MVHLQAHSYYSLLNGVASPHELVGRAAKLGMSALALTDHDGLYGAIPFYQAACEAGIRPILGVDLEGTCVLARNRAGYGQLCALVTAYHLSERFELADYLDDTLLALSSNLAVLAHLLKRGHRPMAAITHTGHARSRARAARVWDFAQAQNIRSVAVHPIYFLDEKGRQIHRVLRAIGQRSALSDYGEGRDDESHGRSGWGCFLDQESMQQWYADWPESLANMERVAEECALELELGRPQFPQWDTPAGEHPYSYLRRLAVEGARRRYRVITPEVAQRLEYELAIIHDLGFASYFLIVADIVRYARDQAIPIVGRGSAANSLVSYVLGMTRVDPLRYDLYFERFLNRSRSDCPDIDLDICWKRRDQVIEYVYRRYGAERVAMICTFNRFRARGAIGDVAKVFGLSEQSVRRVTRRIPPYHAGDVRRLIRHVPECRGLSFEEEPWRSILAIAERIDGFPRHLSVHAGGLVIAPDRLTRFTPLQQAAKGIRVTQYDKDPIEALGLVKMDLLGHRSLTVIHDTVQAVQANRGITLDAEHLPEPDGLIASLIAKGDTIGCFQIESPAMRSLLRNLEATHTDMLITALSLVRPGPSGSGMKKRFLERHAGREPVAPVHPLLDAVLADTYGVMLYQEDILKVAHAVAGLSLAEADGLRRAMTKKRSPEEMASHMKLFVERAIQRGMAPAIAEQIWGQIANFAKYSFCKAHACTYGEIAYQCAYLKAHFPAEFMAAVLSNRGGFYHVGAYITEAQRQGVPIKRPDVNHSRYDYIAEGNAIRMGFIEVRGLSHATVSTILRERDHGPFTSLTNLYRRTGMVASDVYALLASGACDGLGPSRPSLMWEWRIIGRGNREINPKNQLMLFQDERPDALIPRVPEYERKRRIEAEWQSFGFAATEHPLAFFLPHLSTRTLSLSRAMPWYAGKTITMVGWLIAERRVAAANHGAMMFLTLEDFVGVFEAILSPNIYQRWGHLLTSRGPFVLVGEVQLEYHSCTLQVARMERLKAEIPTPEQYVSSAGIDTGAEERALFNDD